MAECIKVLPQVEKWLIYLNQLPLTQGEIEYIKEVYEDCYEDICSIFNILVDIEYRRYELLGSCFTVPISGLKLIAQNNGCDFNPPDPPDPSSDEIYIIGIGSGNSSCPKGGCGCGC